MEEDNNKEIMMMSQRRIDVYKWKELKDIHEKIYRNNTMLSPYQSYEFLSIVGLGKNDKNPVNTIGYKEKNFVIFDNNGEPLAIAPLYAKKDGAGYKILLRGHITSAGHLDFIYRSDFTYEDYCFLINEIKNYYKSGTIYFDRISEHSLVYKYASKNNFFSMKPSVLVTIHLETTYDNWHKELSKHVKQNLRTSYNRLKKDEKKFDFKFYYGNTPNKTIRQDIMHLFARRLCEHSEINSTLVEKALYYLKQRNPMTIGIIKNPEYVGATLYIEDKLAAFFDGIVGQDRRILVPRLAINLDYGRYSPGGILINETMKKIFELGEFTEFDLQRGDEPYKYSYGGIEYNNYTWSDSF